MRRWGVAALVLGLVAVPSAALAVDTTPTPSTSASPAPSPTPTVDAVRQAEYWLEDYGISEAWQITRGKGIKIAIVDTGVGRAPELEDAVSAGTDVSGAGSADGRTPVGAVDKNHGSWVASLAAARGTGENTGMIGVAPEAEILSISVGFGVSSQVPFTDQVAEAMRWAVDNGADVINLSFTTNALDWDESWDAAFQYAFDNDVVVVVAAGNRGSGTNIVGAPATIPGVLTVAGVDPQGKASLEASTQGITIGVSAPSEQLIGVSADGRLVSWSGTSGAAPIVAGIVALVRAAYPELDANNVIERVIATATPATADGQVPDATYGYGLVNAEKALTASVPAVSSNPMGSLTDWVRLYRRAEADPNPAVTPTTTPVAIGPLPVPDGVTKPVSPLLPSNYTLRYGTFPLVAVTVPGILIALCVTVAARRIRSARGTRTPSS